MAAAGGGHRGTERGAEPERLHQCRDGAAVPGGFRLEPLRLRADRCHRTADVRVPAGLRAAHRSVRGAPHRADRRHGAAGLLDRVRVDVRPDLAVLRHSRRDDRAGNDDHTGHLQSAGGDSVRPGARVGPGRRDLRAAAAGRTRRARPGRGESDSRMALGMCGDRGGDRGSGVRRAGSGAAPEPRRRPGPCRSNRRDPFPRSGRHPSADRRRVPV